MEDTFKTVSRKSESLFKEKMSRFISFAFPIRDVDEIKTILELLHKEYYDARHICYAYMLGNERTDFRSNDNGEPSGTAGKPILGQINSFELTNILVVVVRYFGGIKLGTGGLSAAYKEAARLAILENEIVEKTIDDEFIVYFEYTTMNDVMRIVKEENPEVIHQHFDTNCELGLRIRKSYSEKLRKRLEKVESLRFQDKD